MLFIQVADLGLSLVQQLLADEDEQSVLAVRLHLVHEYGFEVGDSFVFLHRKLVIDQGRYLRVRQRFNNNGYAVVVIVKKLPGFGLPFFWVVLDLEGNVFFIGHSRDYLFLSV